MAAGLLRFKRPRVFYGWWVVLASTVIVFYGGGTFFYRNYPYQTAWVQARYHPRREPS